MKIDNSEALHVVCGDSAGGTLRAALRLPKDRVLVNEDQLSCGPAPATSDLSHWRAVREEFLTSMYLDWTEFSLDQYSDNGLLSNMPRLAEGKPLIVWVAPSLGEQLLVAWLTILFDQMELDLSNIQVVQFEHLHPNREIGEIGELSPENIRQFSPEPRQLSAGEISEYRDAWKTYTSSDPADLVHLLSHEPSNRLLSAAMRQLVYRYPSAKTGLSKTDEELIMYAEMKGPKAARIIGYTMAYSDRRDPLGDSYLFYRLRKLSDQSLACPLVSVSGECKSIRSCEARLTDFGQQVLAGKADALQKNGIDDWIGGVHLTPSMPVPFRQGDSLLISQ